MGERARQPLSRAWRHRERAFSQSRKEGDDETDVDGTPRRALRRGSRALRQPGLAQDPSEPIPGVIDLDPTNVKEVLNGMKITIAEFYAPWCGHCKRLTPEYTKLADMIANDPMMSNFVQVVKADCDKHRSLGEP